MPLHGSHSLTAVGYSVAQEFFLHLLLSSLASVGLLLNSALLHPGVLPPRVILRSRER